LTVYHYDLTGHLIAETAPDGTPIRAYLWADGSAIAQIEPHPTSGEETLRYLHTDHLNTPRLATDAEGTVIWRWEGAAFGNAPPNEDPDGDGSPVTINLRFPGQYYDQETGLHYNWNRYYDPRTGRYVTSDPIGLDGGLNTYLYANANPLRFMDPRGLAADDLIILICQTPKTPTPKVCKNLKDCVKKCNCQHVVRMIKCTPMGARCNIRSKQKLEFCLLGCSGAA
jgi:RHS repeat-associated protein